MDILGDERPRTSVFPASCKLDDEAPSFEEDLSAAERDEEEMEAAFLALFKSVVDLLTFEE